MSRKKSVIISRKPDNRNESLSGERLSTQENTLAMVDSTCSGETMVERVGAEPEKTPSLGLLGKALYGVTYGLSYGVVLGVLVIGRLVPGRRIMGQAMSDATESAKQAFAGLGKRPAKSSRRVAAAHEPLQA